MAVSKELADTFVKTVRLLSALSSEDTLRGRLREMRHNAVTAEEADSRELFHIGAREAHRIFNERFPAPEQSAPTEENDDTD